MAFSFSKAIQQVFRPSRYRWWHAVAVGLLANAVSTPGVIGGTRIDSQQRYKARKQAAFAPPGWVFGPAWATNNASVLWGNLKLVNMPASTSGRSPLLWLQGASWVIFSTFSYAYFVLDSPILCFIWTFGMYLITIASINLALKIDPKIAFSLASLFLWLSLASLVAGYQMIYNSDPLFKTPALAR